MKINLFGRVIEINPKIIAAAAAAAVVTLAAALITVLSDRGEVIGSQSAVREETGMVREQSAENANKSDFTAAATASPVAKTPQAGIRVYVSGCVKKIGVVTLNRGSIIEDAIKAAGGATPDADLENINLAYELNDNDMIKIPPKKKQAALTGSNANNPATVNNFSVPVVKDSGGAVLDSSAQGGGSKVNINTATVEELDTLPNIGVETAKDIIDYREKNGGFKTVSDIMKVSGIKESRFSRIKDMICVD